MRRWVSGSRAQNVTLGHQRVSSWCEGVTQYQKQMSTANQGYLNTQIMKHISCEIKKSVKDINQILIRVVLIPQTDTDIVRNNFQMNIG